MKHHKFYLKLELITKSIQEIVQGKKMQKSSNKHSSSLQCGATCMRLTLGKRKTKFLCQHIRAMKDELVFCEIICRRSLHLYRIIAIAKLSERKATKIPKIL
jgi:hypothetical protein